MSTIVEAKDFVAEGPAMSLHEAMEGWGSNSEVIVDIISHHTNEQRQAIAEMYKSIYNEDLRERLQSELRGDFEQITTALLTPPSLYDARKLNAAMDGLGTDESMLIEIMCSRNEEEIAAVKETYEKEFGKKLEEDLDTETSGYFKQLLKDQLLGVRDENKEVDSSTAKDDAKTIFELQSKDKWGCGVLDILCARSFAHLRAVFTQYAKIAGKDIEEELLEESSSNFRDGLLAIVRIARSKHAYFASKLYNAMKGYGTDDDALIRIVVSRSEIDLACIKPVFYVKYGQSLSQFFKEETGGDYMRMLVSVLGTANASN